MTTEESKERIALYAGVPRELLNGETVQDNLNLARELISFKNESIEERAKSPQEQFADWLRSLEGEQSHEEIALANIEEMALSEAGGYPRIKDGGEVAYREKGSAKEQFSEWLYQVSAYDPKKRH